MTKILQKIFSVKNSENKKHKVICLLGIKFKFPKKKNSVSLYIEKPTSSSVLEIPSCMGDEALRKLISSCNFDTVLDIGCGEGIQSKVFVNAGKKVTGIDYGNSPYFDKNKETLDIIIGNFNTYEFSQKYDCIWASHILEHQINVNYFLKKIYNLLNDKGYLAITVPPAKNTIVGGHVSVWNAGLLLYNLVLAGFDCSDAMVKTYGYNVSVIVQKKDSLNLENLSYDAGDITKIKKYLPKNILYSESYSDICFDGNISELNWD